MSTEYCPVLGYMGTYAPPIRIPKLKVRAQNDEITSISNTQIASPEPRDASPAPASSSSSSSTSTAIHAPTPQRPNQTAHVVSTNDTLPKKKGGLMGFLSVKEPSTSAFAQYAGEQKKAAALKSTRSVGLQNVSQQKMPDYVPKVNSKWDGMPSIAHEPGHDAWKRSVESGSFLGRISKRSSTTDTSRISNASSLNRSRGGSSGSSSQRSSKRNSRQSNNTRSSRTPSTKPLSDPLSLPQSPTDARLQSPQQSSSPNIPRFPTNHIDFDGHENKVHTPTHDKANESTETLKAAELRALPVRENSSGVVASPKPLSDFSHIHPAFRPQQVEPQDEVTETGKDTPPHRPDGAFPESPHRLPIVSENVPSKTPSPPAAVNSQWPLPPSSGPMFKNSGPSVPPPPVSIQQAQSPQRQKSPSSPPQSPSRSGSASPRNFARPFNTGPLTPPTPQSPTFPDPTPPADSIAGPAFQPLPSNSVAGPIFRPSQHAFASRALRPPASAIGRSITKDSALTPIIESDASSLVSVPVRESHVLGDSDQDVAESQESERARPMTADSQATEPARRSIGAQSHERDGESIREFSIDTDTASIRSEMSASWYRSPKERLGLGGLIKHDRGGVPWPLQQEEDLDFVAGSGAMSAELEKEINERDRKRRTFMGFMKR